MTLLLLGCATAAPPNKAASLPEPDIRISQLSNVSEVARHSSGNLSVQYRVEIVNRASQAITVKRVDVTSLGEGAYTIRPMSGPFNAAVNPGEGVALQFWAPAFISDPTIIGANGPVTLRVLVQYDTPAGGTQSIVVQQVHPLAGID